MIKESIDNIQDKFIKIFLKMLYILINKPETYSFGELVDVLGCQEGELLLVFRNCISLTSDYMEYYIGNNKLDETNVQMVLESDSTDKLSLVSRMNIVDENAYQMFYSLYEDFIDSKQKRKCFNEITIWDSFKTVLREEKTYDNTKIIKALAEMKTYEYELKLNSEHFFPIAIYSSCSENREYFVSISGNENSKKVKFFPCDSCEMISYKEINDIKKVYGNYSLIKNTLDRLKDIWGPRDMFISEEYFDVEAIIYDESCISKITHDISNRKMVIDKNTDNTYTFKGKVLGYESFKAWVLSYGSSIEIRSPMELRKDLQEIYRRIYNSYM